MLTEHEQIVKEWQESPLKLHAAISDKKLWGKQVEILQAVRKYPRIAVRSGNTVGKTKIAAEIVIDWLFTNYPSKVVTTSASYAQVEEALWKEIGSLWTNLPFKVKGELQKVGLFFDNDHFAVGLSVDKPVRLQGRHSPNLLVLVDEASGIDSTIWDMFEALHPKTIIVLGNPLDATGRFAECFMSDKWHKITVSCEDCVQWQEANGKIPGLVTREWVKDMADLHGIKSAWYRVHVLGLPPEQDEFALIERQWVDRARKGLDADGLPLEKEDEDVEVKIIPFDIASKHGENETVIGFRYGHTFKTIKGYRKQTSTFIRDMVQSMYSKLEAQVVVHDADGLGESMAEQLSEMHVPSLEFHGGYAQKATNGKFRNLRSQFYWIVAKKFEKGLYDLSQLNEQDFEILRSQLCSIRVKPEDGMGRFQIETKEELMARGIKSPDYADCYVLGEYGFYMHKMIDVQPRNMGVL
jgi:phage terminase large subunit